MTTGVISGTATIPVPVVVVILTSGFLVIIGGSGGPPDPSPLSTPILGMIVLILPKNPEYNPTLHHMKERVQFYQLHNYSQYHHQ